MSTFLCMTCQLDESRSVELGYCAEKDGYLIIGRTGESEARLGLSAEAMDAICHMYALHLRKQAQCAPDGVGAVLA